MPKINLSQLQQRLLSGFILGPIVVLVIIYGGWPFAVMVAGFAVIALYEWVQLSLKIKNKIPYFVLGTAYVLFCFWCLYAIRAFFPVQASLLFIALIWSSDIGAYAVGKTIGGPKMSKEISPNKTWSGFVGAAIFPAVVMLISVFIAFYEFKVLLTFKVIEALFIFGAAFGALGQFGDMVVSFAKRKAKIKDSSDLIPGHGGVLDRVDSMMLVAPIFLYFIWLFNSVSSSF